MERELDWRIRPFLNAARLTYTLTGAGADVPLGWVDATAFTDRVCFSGADAAYLQVVETWPPFTEEGQCKWPNRTTGLTPPPQVRTAPENTSGFAAGVAAVTPRIQARFRELRAEILDNWPADDGSLTSGKGTQATNARAAAERVGGAQTLLNGYVALGLPQAIATDDTLRGLVAGDRRNALARPIGDDGRAEPASNVPDQVAAFIRFLQPRQPVGDVLVSLGLRFEDHRRALEASITPFVREGRAAGQSAGRRRAARPDQPRGELHDRPTGAQPGRARRPPRPARPGRPRPRRRRSPRRLAARRLAPGRLSAGRRPGPRGDRSGARPRPRRARAARPRTGDHVHGPL